MSNVTRGRASPLHNRVSRAYFNQGLVGLLLLLLMTWQRTDEPSRVLSAHGTGALALTAVLFLFPLVLSFLKFPLTEEIFVSFAMIAFIATVPLLGMILGGWVAVSAVIVNRLIDTVRMRLEKGVLEDSWAQHIRTFSLFGTYGIPIVLATLAYEASGGAVPLVTPSIPAAGQITLAGLVMIAANALIMARVQFAYGYASSKVLRSTTLDASLLALGIPFAFIMTFSHAYVGWFGLVACAFSGVVVNSVVRNLALARTSNAALVGRLASLTNIGKTISISSSREDLLLSIHTECARAVDARFFNIAILDQSTNELVFELDIEDGQRRPPSRASLGVGLNSWIVQNGKPLLLRTAKEEAVRGLQSIDDGLASEAWLGVPMTVHDRVLGVISVQSRRKGAFDEDDLILLSAVANQAAVALENAELYRHLETMNVALEERVAERTNELRETNLRLLAADRTKNEFLAHMSHELRTPLNSVIGFSRVLLDKTEGEISPRLHRFIENIHASGTHLLSLINAILDLAKIEAGRLDLEIDRFNLREAMASVDSVVKGMAADADVSIVTTVDERIGDVSMDEGRVKQILINLLSNAVKFSPPKEFVRLDATFIPGPTSPLRCDTIRLEVSDHGTGIPADDLARIFDEFYQVRRSAGKLRTGTGLGLALTKRFVELHHGIITVDSAPGRGSKFSAYLPVRQDLAELAPGEPQKVVSGEGE